MSSQLPEKTNARNIGENIIISGNQFGSVSPPASSGHLNAHDIAKEKVLQTGATSVGFVVTDGNPDSQGTAVHTAADSYTIEAGATEVGAVGSQQTADLTMKLYAQYRNLFENPQMSQASRTNVPDASTIPSSNPSSRSVPPKASPSNVRSFTDYQDTTDGGIQGGNTVAGGILSQDLSEQVREKRLNSDYIKNYSGKN